MLFTPRWAHDGPAVGPIQIGLEHQLGPDPEIHCRLLITLARHSDTAMMPIHLFRLYLLNLTETAAGIL